MSKGTAKTNAMRMLDRAGIAYRSCTYEIGDEEFCGEAVARLVGIEPERAFKTLVAKGEKRGYLVFVIPVDREVDLKAAAAVAGDKRVELVHTKELLGLTGYVRGGVSPVGMKKQFPTFVDQSALEHEEIGISGGMKGCQLLLKPAELIRFIDGKPADLCRKGGGEF